MEKLLSMREVIEITGLSRQQIWVHRRAGAFPQPCKTSERRVGFLASEIQSWIKARVSERDREAAVRAKALK